ncbi:MAG: DUF5131 family protein [Bacillota bacterium]|nr:phage Gp37/Gp68 family protein [Candidatus Fermentithermobacillaceae bacterium]
MKPVVGAKLKVAPGKAGRLFTIFILCLNSRPYKDPVRHGGNPVTGCTKVSEGCRNCYAERMAYRLQSMGNYKYRNGFKVTIHPEALDIPLSWTTPRLVFVNSMSDLFHGSVPLELIESVVDVISRTPHHRYQILTKRPHRLLKVSKSIIWPDNAWIGVTVEEASLLWRLDLLREVNATIRFVSFEPLLSQIPGLDLTDIHWVIVGGESGPDARPMKAAWVRDIRDACLKLHIPFFFKQWGGTYRSAHGRVLDGKIWSQMPIAD